MKNATWKKITAIAVVLGILIPGIPDNSYADEIVIYEETEYSAEEEPGAAGNLLSEDELIVEESDDGTSSVDDGISTVEELSIDETEVMVEEDLLASDSDFETEESLEKKTAIGSITIDNIYRVLSNETTANPTNKAETCTFTLYGEDGVTPVSTRQLTIPTFSHKSSSSVSFDNLDEGVYYLKETDTTGNVPAKIKYLHTFLDTDGKWENASGTQSEDGIKISIRQNASAGDTETVEDIHKVDFTNVYNQADTCKGSFKIRVRVVDEDNKEIPITLTAGFTVKWASGGKNWTAVPNPSLSMQNEATVTSKRYSIPFPASDQQAAAKVKMESLIDCNGNNVIGKYKLVDDQNYTKLFSYQKTIIITDGMIDGLVTFTLKQELLLTVSKKPAIKKPASTKNKVTVKWSHFKHTSRKAKRIWKKIKKVQVQCAADKGFTNIVKTVMVGKGKKKTAIKGLQKNTTYYVRVRYFDGTGYSAWSKVRKVKTKK